MSCTNYRCIEMQNNNIGAVAVNGLMPFGNITRRLSKTTGQGVPFDIATSGADTIQITSKGYYTVRYTATVTLTAVGPVTLTLLVNGTALYSVSTTGVIGSNNLTLIKMVRVFANCASCSTNCPANIQVQLSGSAITGGTSDIIVDSCVNG